MTTEQMIQHIAQQIPNHPDLYDLLDGLRLAARKETVEDICIDLKDFDEHEAVAIIKANY